MPLFDISIRRLHNTKREIAPALAHYWDLGYFKIYLSLRSRQTFNVFGIFHLSSFPRKDLRAIKDRFMKFFPNVKENTGLTNIASEHFRPWNVSNTFLVENALFKVGLTSQIFKACRQFATSYHSSFWDSFSRTEGRINWLYALWAAQQQRLRHKI